MCQIWRSTEVFKRAYHRSHLNLLVCTASHTGQLQFTIAPQWMPRNSYINPPSLDKTTEHVSGSPGYLSFVALPFTHLRHWTQNVLQNSHYLTKWKMQPTPDTTNRLRYNYKLALLTIISVQNHYCSPQLWCQLYDMLVHRSLKGRVNKVR
jgi:hypothetical protein